MTIPQKTISSFVSDMIATWSVQTNTQNTFFDGDPLLAFWQSVAAQLDFLQAEVQQVLSLARAQTSSGADLDSWMAQFNFFRLPGNLATTTEMFSIQSPSSQQIVVPNGVLVQTVGGAFVYQVVADTTQPTYSASAGGYVLAPGQTSLLATVQAVQSGSAYNVLANTIVQFGSSVPGISAVTNPSPVTNGDDPESDAAFRSRFILYLATLAKATYSALLAAIQSVQQGLLVALLENVQPNGSPLLGSFTAVVDDGSGNPPLSLLNAVYAAVDATRAFSVQPFVVAPAEVTASIALSVNLVVPLPVGVSAASVNTGVKNAIAAMTNGLGPGSTLHGSAIITAALSVPYVVAVDPSTVTINGGTSDLVPSIQQEIRTTVPLITVTNY